VEGFNFGVKGLRSGKDLLKDQKFSLEGTVKTSQIIQIILQTLTNQWKKKRRRAESMDG
jgi:hypothetical protein